MEASKDEAIIKTLEDMIVHFRLLGIVEVPTSRGVEGVRQKVHEEFRVRLEEAIRGLGAGMIDFDITSIERPEEITPDNLFKVLTGLLMDVEYYVESNIADEPNEQEETLLLRTREFLGDGDAGLVRCGNCGAVDMRQCMYPVADPRLYICGHCEASEGPG